MTPDKTQKLLNRFPEIYIGYYLSEETSLMSRGFQCKDGWFELIWRMSEEIETLANAQGIPIPEMSEIKQKMGGLRVRLFSNNKAIKTTIRDAEEMALTTCETCGESGKLHRMKGLISVRCYEHANGARPVYLK